MTRHTRREVETKFRRCFTTCPFAAIRSGWDWRRWKRRAASGGLRILPGRPAASPEGDPCLPGLCAAPDEKGPGAARNLASCLWGKGRLSGAVPAPVFRGASGASKRAGRQLCDPKPSGGSALFAGAGSHGAGRRGYAGGPGEHEKLEIVRTAEVGSGRNRPPAHTLF